MSRSVNKVILVGHVGQDPEGRSTPAGTRVCNTSLATNGRKRQDGSEPVFWHRLTFWGKTAQFVEEYVRKGSRIYTEGRIEYGSYEKTGDSGEMFTVPTAEIIVHEVVLLSPKENGNDNTSPEADEEFNEDPQTELDG